MRLVARGGVLVQREIQRNGYDMGQKYWSVPQRALTAWNLANLIARRLGMAVNNLLDRPKGPAL